jgi:hypothetical protein
MRSMRRLYNEEKLQLLKIGMICSVKPALTVDLRVVQREEFSITCYMCEMYT